MKEFLNVIVLVGIASLVFYGLLRHFLNLTRNPTKLLQIVGYVGLAIGSGMALLFFITVLRNIVSSFSQ